MFFTGQRIIFASSTFSQEGSSSALLPHASLVKHATICTQCVCDYNYKMAFSLVSQPSQHLHLQYKIQLLRKPGND